MKGIAVPDGACDILDGEPGKLQKFCGFDHPVLDQEFLGRLSQGLAEEGAEITAVQATVPGDVFHGYIILEVLFNEGDGFFDIEVLDLSAGSALKGSHGAGQVIQEQKAVAQEMVGGFFTVVDDVEHLFHHKLAKILGMAVIDGIAGGKADHLQSFFHPDAIELQPGIFPGDLPVCRVGTHLAGEQHEALTGADGVMPGNPF